MPSLLFLFQVGQTRGGGPPTTCPPSSSSSSSSSSSFSDLHANFHKYRKPWVRAVVSFFVFCFFFLLRIQQQEQQPQELATHTHTRNTTATTTPTPSVAIAGSQAPRWLCAIAPKSARASSARRADATGPIHKAPHPSAWQPVRSTRLAPVVPTQLVVCLRRRSTRYWSSSVSRTWRGAWRGASA